MQDFTKGMADVPANFGVKKENLQKIFIMVYVILDQFSTT